MKTIALTLPRSRAYSAGVAWFCFALVVYLFAGPTSARAGEVKPLQVAKALSEAFADVAERVSPAVVGIVNEREVEVPDFYSRRSPFSGPQDLEEMLRRFHRGEPMRPREDGENEGESKTPRRKESVQRLGSGVVIDKDGHILTNNHVVEEADTLKVYFSNETILEAEVVGTDPKTDLAVIKLKEPKKDLVVAPLGNSDVLRVGNLVMAIGNPGGLDLMKTVTIGIVSAKDRSIGSAAMHGIMYQDFIQTDAAINRGNSGGPLINLDGEVIGINTMIHSASGGSDGIGFAVPINVVKSVASQLIDSGKVTRGWLGVGIRDLSPEMIEALEEVSGGVAIGEVYPGTPAADAGLQAGDILTHFGKVKLESAKHLQNLVAATPPGKTVKVALLRQGKKETLNLTIGTQPDRLADMGQPAPTPKKPEKQTAELETLGLEVQTATDELRKRFSHPGKDKGVIVTRVMENGPAAELELEPGTLILQLDQKPVPDVETLRGVVKAIAKKKILILYRRPDSPSEFGVLTLK